MNKRKPKQKRSRQKYDEIIRVTSRVISDGLFFQTSTNEIAKQANVGIGTLYEYFDNKEDILAEVLEYEITNIAKLLEAKVPEWIQKSTAEALESLAAFAVDLAEERAGLIKVVLGQIPDLMQLEAIVRLLGQAEMLIKILLVNEPRLHESAHNDANVFIFLNALIGLLLGIARGLPSGLDKEDIVLQMKKMFEMTVDNLDAIA